MPFTPFHVGPGAVFKILLRRYFSLGVFFVAQVFTDIEVLVHMALQDARLHAFAHTFVGASAVAVVTVLVGRPLWQWCLRWWNSETGLPFQEYIRPDSKVPWIAAITGAFLGTWSHVVLDSLAHNDLRPWFPFNSEAHPFGRVNAGVMHLACFCSGIISLIIYAVLNRKNFRRPT